MSNSALELYQKYYQERQFERLDLFEIVAEQFNIRRAMYAGSFVHITPSFVIPEVVYVDNDKQAKQFFSKPEVFEWIAQRKIYPQDAKVSFHFADFRNGVDEPVETVDLLISQYAGFVGQHCKPYLKPGGLLLANNSHGDAGLAALDEDYQLKAVFFLRNSKYRISESNLDTFFVPKTQQQITKAYLEKLQKGIGYKKTASVYLFKKVQMD